MLVSSVSGGSLATAYFVTHGASGSLAKGAAEEYETSFIKKMSIDFMAPLLRGVLTMRLERGEAVAHFWRDKFAWQNEFDTTERKAKRPLVVLNATDVQSGERVGMGFPALPAGLLTPARVTADLSPGLRINLADGVRTSANFPYGFEYVKLGDRPYELIDGGVVDNTGLDTLTLVLEGLGRTATDPKMSKEDRALAERARDGLRDRGLLVVEIDAGARPEKPKGLAAHVPSLSKPLEALGRAGHRNSAALRARWLERLKTAIDPPFVGLVRAGADCTPEGDVITAWALDRRERRKIFDTFHVTEKRLTKALELQQRSIRRMHALRRAMLAGDPTAKELATTLSGAHQDYQERVSQHATDQYLCAPAEDTQHKDPTPDEKTPDPAAELKGVEDALKLALRGSLDGTAPSPLPGVPAAAPATAPPAAAPPAPVEVVAAPAIEDREALGWVYLGTRVGQKWQTRYATWQGPPQAGVRVRLIGRSNLRASMPDENGASGKIRMALPSNAELDILEVRSWGDIFVWARVAAPK